MVLPRGSFVEPPSTQIVIAQEAQPDYTVRRELALAAWLAEKSGLSQSAETQRAYSAIMMRFRAALHRVSIDLESPAAQIKPVAEAFASAGRVKAATHNRRLAIISSFYTYAIEGGLLEPPNPIDKVKRRKVQPYRAARALDASFVRRCLAQIDRATLAGMRDYALLSVTLVTGRRVSELAGLRVGDLETTGSGRIRLTWQRTKGDETHADLLPPKISAALLEYLAQLYPEWDDAPPAEGASVWARTGNHGRGGPISSQAIADICQRHLKTSRVHRLRHTFAKNMEKHKAPLSVIQQRLGHKNIATTSIYLQALTEEENPYAEAIEQTIIADTS